MSSKKENNLFPIFLKLDQLKTLIVGAGNVGLEKLEAILKNDPNAKVRIVGPEVKSEINSLAQYHQHLEIIIRKYQIEDLKDIDLVILATADRATNLEILKEVKQKGILANVADTPDLCDFYLGSTVKKGNLKVGISTNGQSPTFAKRFREILEEIIPDETDDLLDNLRIVRDSLKGDFEHKVKELNKLTKSLTSNKSEKKGPAKTRP